MKYLIKVIPQEPNAEVEERLLEGIECDGFVVLGNAEDHSACAIHQVSNMDIAIMLAASDEMMGAAIIAKAMRDARKFLSKAKADKVASGLLSRILEGYEDEDSRE